MSGDISMKRFVSILIVGVLLQSSFAIGGQGSKPRQAQPGALRVAVRKEARCFPAIEPTFVQLDPGEIGPRIVE